MTDNRRDFLLRFAAAALAALGGESALSAKEPTRQIAELMPSPMVLYGPPPRRLVKGPALITTELFFVSGRLRLTADSASVLRRQITWLKQQDDYLVTLKGNCDERGTSEYNLALGQRRADAVKRLMIESGIAAERITAISLGKEQPQDLGHTKEAWAHNSRVDMLFTRP